MFSIEVALGSDNRVHRRTPLDIEANAVLDPQTRTASDRKTKAAPDTGAENSERGFLCRVSDISAGGVRLDTYSTLEKGTIVTLSLLKGLAVPARVVWSKELEVGCAFLVPLEQWTVNLIVSTGGRGIYDAREYI